MNLSEKIQTKIKKSIMISTFVKIFMKGREEIIINANKLWRNWTTVMEIEDFNIFHVLKTIFTQRTPSKTNVLIYFNSPLFVSFSPIINIFLKIKYL